MKKVLLLLFIISLFSVQWNWNEKYFFKKQYCSQVIDKQYFKICYDYSYKGAKAVYYQLKKNLVDKEMPRLKIFHLELKLEKKYQSNTKDYIKSGYDRGHMASDASFDFSVDSRYKSYSMANVVPQIPLLNRYRWSKAENLSRKMADKYGVVNVLDLIYYNKNPKRIGKSKIAVPFRFIKIIWDPKTNWNACYGFKNNKESNVSKDLEHYKISCNKINFE